MAEYKLKFTEEQEEEDNSRQETLRELVDFMDEMDDLAMAVITLNDEQSLNWDSEGETDYQDYYGQEIIHQIADDGETQALVIRNAQKLPVAMASRNPDAIWQGISIDKRLRADIAALLQIDESSLE